MDTHHARRCCHHLWWHAVPTHGYLPATLAALLTRPAKVDL